MTFQSILFVLFVATNVHGMNRMNWQAILGDDFSDDDADLQAGIRASLAVHAGAVEPSSPNFGKPNTKPKVREEMKSEERVRPGRFSSKANYSPRPSISSQTFDTPKRQCQNSNYYEDAALAKALALSQEEPVRFEGFSPKANSPRPRISPDTFASPKQDPEPPREQAKS